MDPIFNPFMCRGLPYANNNLYGRLILHINILSTQNYALVRKVLRITSKQGTFFCSKCLVFVLNTP